MTVLDVVQYPNLLLRRKGKYVTDLRAPAIHKEITDMLETLAIQKECAALAAPQLYLNDPHNIIVFNLPNYSGQEGVWGLVNPVILAKEGVEVGEEGCMSIAPQYFSFPVKRAAKIKVKGFNLEGEALLFEATGLLARCIQHECDHLKGILYVDHLSSNVRRRFERQLKKVSTLV